MPGRSRALPALLLLLSALAPACREEERSAPTPAAPPAAPAPPAPAASPSPPAGPVSTVRPEDVNLDVLAAGPEVTALGRSLTGEPLKALASLAATLRQRHGKARLIEPGVHGLRPLRPPESLAAGIAHPIPLASLEASALLVAAARSAGLRATVAEAYMFADGTTPDPGGSTGYFVVAVPSPTGPATFVDPFGDSSRRAVTTAQGLDDGGLRAAWLMLDALGRLAVDPEDTKRAGELLDAARAQKSTRTATLWALEGRLATMLHRPPAEVLAAAEQAVKARDDGPRRFVLAQARAAALDAVGAKKELDAALARGPLPSAVCFAASRQLATGDPDAAATTLASLPARDATHPCVLRLRAEMAIKQASRAEAAAALRKALAADPTDLDHALAVFGLYRMLGDKTAANQLRLATLRTAANPEAAQRAFAAASGAFPSR